MAKHVSEGTVFLQLSVQNYHCLIQGLCLAATTTSQLAGQPDEPADVIQALTEEAHTLYELLDTLGEQGTTQLPRD